MRSGEGKGIWKSLKCFLQDGRSGVRVAFRWNYHGRFIYSSYFYSSQNDIFLSGLNIYKASAGSGKTYTLTREFIRLMISNPNHFRNILAVTFTNKATAEMKSRILNELYALATLTDSDHIEHFKEDYLIKNYRPLHRKPSTWSCIIIRGFISRPSTGFFSGWSGLSRVKLDYLLLITSKLMEKGSLKKQWMDS